MEFQIIRSIIARILDLPQEEIREDSRLVEDLYADSMKLFQILIETEKEFEMNFPFERIGEIRTAGDIYRLIQES